MQIHSLAPGISVSPQVLPADMDAIRQAGFRSLICNRPDGEGN
ncbi:MAG: TIGR01244 family phosphatase, partial [Oxalobacteraceae bacterium]